MRFLIGEGFGSALSSFHDEFIERGIDGQRIIAGKTGETEGVQRPPGRLHHAFDIEIAETIHAEIFTEILHRHLIGDQFFRIGNIDSVVAGEPVWWTAHPHMHLLGAGLAQVHHARPRSRAAYD